MSANASSSLLTSKTPLDYIAEGYWQDFVAGRPVAGGIAYEAQLHNCQLDESLLSLQRVDTLITQIRRDITKSAVLDEAMLLADESYRNLLIFLAFYAGRVLANEWQQAPQWYGHFELRRHYADLTLDTDDFYQHMAVIYCNSFNQKSTISSQLFFALEPIGLRLFGHIDRQFVAVQGGQVASGLYQAVSARLPVADQNNLRNANIAAIEPNTEKLVDDRQGITKSDVIESVVDQIETQNTATNKNRTVLPTPEIFTQLLTELDEIKRVQTVGIDDYSQACKILNQFERHIAQQQKPRAQVIFSDTHQTARRQALLLLEKSATAGNTAAMLRLAMYELLSEGLIIDQLTSQNTGADLVKQAAKEKDSRAQRLLSRMYYQGIGVPQSMSDGKQWLEQAADNGHEEAATIVAQWQQAQTLIATQQQEQYSMKRYQLLIGAVLVVSVLLFIFVQ